MSEITGVRFDECPPDPKHPGREEVMAAVLSQIWDSIVLRRGRGKYGLDPWLEWNERRATKKNLDTPEIRV